MAYRKEAEANDMIALPGSHLYVAEEKGRLVAWTLGHPATFGKVYDGEKSFVPVAEYVIPEKRRQVARSPYWMGLLDHAKAQGFDFVHMRPDAPFMTTPSGERLIQRRFERIRDERGLGKNEGFIGDNIMCLDADKVDRILEERARQRQIRQNASADSAAAQAKGRSSWYSWLMPRSRARSHAR
jgi:hypothetical protein